MVFSIWLVEWFEQGKLETAEKMMCFYAENEKHKFSLLPRKLFGDAKQVMLETIL
jgi:hypothetical protein